MSEKYYVYVHLLGDSEKYQPFYIGKGSGTRYNASETRSKKWKNIVNNHGFKVQILASELDQNTAFELESAMIHVYRHSFGDQIINQQDRPVGYSKQARVDAKKQRVIDFFQKHKRLPKKNIPEEHPLYITFNMYKSKSFRYFDADFRNKLIELGFQPRRNKELLIEFIKEKNRLPIYKKEEEHDLYMSMMRIRHEDKDVSNLMQSCGYLEIGTEKKHEKLKNDAINFIKQNNRFPNRYIEEEKKLQRAIGSFCSRTSDFFDKDFLELMKTFGRTERAKAIKHQL